MALWLRRNRRCRHSQCVDYEIRASAKWMICVHQLIYAY